MRLLRLLFTVPLRIRSVFRRDQVEQDLEDEFRDHLERRIEADVARGMPADEARYAALQAMGGLEQRKEECRDMRGTQFVDQFRQDISYACRMLRRNRGFTATVVVTLALGIGVNTAIFSLFNVFLRPLAVKDPASIVNVDWGGSENRWLTFREYIELRNDVRSVSELVARADRTVMIGAEIRGEAPVRVAAAFVSDNYLSTLGASVTLGRSFVPDENAVTTAHPVALMSHAFWQRRFGGDAAVLGRQLQVGGASFTVIGVTAPGFAGLERTAPDLWLPLSIRTKVAPREGEAELFGPRGRRWLLMSGRLAPGRTLETARAELAVAATRFVEPDRDVASKARLRLMPGSTLGARRNFAPTMIVVLVLTLMVLLIACSNIANLMLARGAARRKELGVRLSVGASRPRLIRQLLTESTALATLGGVSGLLLAWWSLKTFLASALFSQMGVVDSFEATVGVAPDWRVLLFTLLLSGVTAIAFGVMPAVRSTRGDLAASVKEASGAVGSDKGGAKLRSLLIVGEVAVCFVLLIASGLLLRGLAQLDSIQPGFDPTQVLVVQPRLDLLGYDDSRAHSFHSELASRLVASPGVQTVTRVASVPLGGMPRRPIELEAEGESARGQLRAFRNAVAPNYFEALQIRILRGRGFTEEDTHAGASVVVVSASMSRRLWPNQECLGKLLRPEPEAPFAEVIGVAEDVQVRLDDPDPLFFYMPLKTWAGTTQLVRTSGELQTIRDRALADARSLDPNVLVDVAPLAEIVAASGTVSAARVASTLTASLGFLALLLAGVGLYGVMAYSVAERRAEMAIRIALGASGAQVQGLIMRQGLLLVIIGATLGILAGASLTRLLSSLLFGLSPFDAAAYAGVLVFLFTVALVATWLPARRVTTIDPMIVLRSN